MHGNLSMADACVNPPRARHRGLQPEPAHAVERYPDPQIPCIPRTGRGREADRANPANRSRARGRILASDASKTCGTRNHGRSNSAATIFPPTENSRTEVGSILYARLPLGPEIDADHDGESSECRDRM